ncbi:hypothetical protein [Adlercreutzia caecimuris]|uniref:hypothetical protein n=1 Tax=Adlercreutzia caecimuris TaxID=671266 RepID=UPI0025AF0427|nr:hypothetical protein [Adlercreutzia caecimuris]
MRRRVILGIVIFAAAAIGYASLIFIMFDVVPDEISIKVSWTAGDALLCGMTVMSACAAIWGIYLTLQNSQYQFSETYRLSVVPCVTMTQLVQKNRRSFFNERMKRDLVGDEASSYDDTNALDNSYCVAEERDEYAILGEEIIYRRSLTETQRDLVEHRDLERQDAAGGHYYTVNPVSYLPLLFKSVGSGPAVNVRRGIQRLPLEGEKKYTEPRTLLVGEESFLGVYIDTSDEAAFGEYEITLSFYDIVGNHYEQKFGLEVGRDDEAEGGRTYVAHTYVVERELVAREAEGTI